MSQNNDINELFKLRDKAVNNKDLNLFLSTQVSEIEGGGSQNYITLDSLKSEILKVYDESDMVKVIFVKETYLYQPNGKEPYSSYPVYFLTNTIKGWKIYKVR